MATFSETRIEITANYNKGDNSLIDNNIIAAMLVAFTVSTAAMVALRPVAKSVGLIDVSGGRKAHLGGVPVVGGLAIFAGMFAALTMTPNAAYDYLPLFVASSILVLIGLVDDKYHIPATIRMSTQIAVVLVMVYGANLSLVSIGDPFGSGEVYMGRFILIFTMLVTVSMINAYNFIDGIDGLTGTLALIAFVALSIAAGLDHPGMAVALVTAAAVIGFLIFNLPISSNRQVRCFMGDAGSTLLGFTIVWITLGISQGAERSISPVHALWFASIPIFDFFTCFVRRVLKGKTPFTPGRDHIHHILKRGGFDQRETLVFLAVLQSVYASIGLAAHFAAVPDVYLFTAWSVLGLSQTFVIRKIARANRARTLQSARQASNLDC